MMKLTTEEPGGYTAGGTYTGSPTETLTGIINGTIEYVFTPATSGDDAGYGPSSCTLTGATITDTNVNTRLPSSRAPLTSGSDPYFDAYFQCWVLDGSFYTISGWGAFGDGSYTAGSLKFPNATQWTNLNDSASLLPCAFAVYGSDRNGGGLPDGFNPDATYLPGFLVKSKYAEVILLTAPSHDFARPCGTKDAETIDQTTITTCYGADSPCNLGSLRWGDLPAPCAAGAWNDNFPKGDWLLVTWNFNFRQTPLTVTGAWSGITLDQHCSQYLPCCPAVVYVTPNGETSANSTTIDFSSATGSGNLALDDCYGSRISVAPMQWMVDPLWQVPIQSEACHSGAGQWIEDDGSGHIDGDADNVYYYPQRPWEEARASVPGGAPGLPSGCYLPAMSVSDINTNGSYPPEPNRVVYPPNGGACFSPVWTWALNRAANIAAGHRFSCDYADPFAVCGDNTELEPP